MKLTIDFGEPILPKEKVLEITLKDLEEFYGEISEVNDLNLFFVLLTSIHYYEEEEDRVRAAHLCYLASWYVFLLLTPPGSWELAMYYMKRAIALNDQQEYRETLEYMKKGN